MKKEEIIQVHDLLLDLIKSTDEPYSVSDLVKEYQQLKEYEKVPKGYIWEAIRMLLASPQIKLRTDLKIEPSSSEISSQI